MTAPIVITGGNDGIGNALAEVYLRRGVDVVVVGRSAGKGKAFLDAARAIDGGRATFLQADLALVAENRRVLDELSAFDAIRALILCARFYRSTRAVTAEGVEESFGLFYLSRYLLGHGLAAQLARGERPVIANVCGPSHQLGLIAWDDLELARAYHGGAALGQGGKLNDLLGVDFADRYGDGPIRYVLHHPGVVATAHTGEYHPSMAEQMRALKRTGKPVETAVPPILATLDNPPGEPLSAFVEGKRLTVAHLSFALADARRLAGLTEERLATIRVAAR